MSAFSRSGGGAVKGEIRQFRDPVPPVGWGKVAGQGDFGAVGTFGHIQEPDSGAAAFAYAQGVLYAAGTYGGAWLRRYEPGTGEWVSLSPPPGVLSSNSLVGLFVGLPDGRLLFGGAGSADSQRRSMQTYDPVLGAWSTLAPADSGSLSVNNVSILLSDTEILTFSQTYSSVFNILTNSWTATNHPGLPSLSPAGLLPSGKVLAVKGSDYAIFDPHAEPSARWSGLLPVANPGVLLSNLPALVPSEAGVLIYGHAQASATSWQPVFEFNEASGSFEVLANLKTFYSAASSTRFSQPARFPGGGFVIAPGLLAITDAFQPVGNCFAAKL